MSYLVIARKYRPLIFDDLVGQEAIVTTLKNAIKSDRVAHAYLFAGPRGVGKTSMARIMSKALNCVTGVSGSPCNECDICKSISNGSDVDVLEIDGASNRGVDEIRNIRQNVNYTPSRSQYKIYIIDEVHMLTKEAFNALLKTLEEPPSHVKFIFATTNVDKLPDTVQSRCQRFDFKEISLEEIENQIALICKKENITADEDVLNLIAKYARGGLRDALSILDQLISFSNDEITVNDVHTVLGTINEELMFGITDNILRHDVKNAIQSLEEVFNNNGKGVTEFIDQIVWYLRDLLMALVFRNEARKNENLSEYQKKLLTNHKELSIDILTYMIQILSEVRRKVKDDRHKRILLEVAIIKLTTTEDISAINDLLDRIENIEKSLIKLSNNHAKGDDIKNGDEDINGNRETLDSKVNGNDLVKENCSIDAYNSKPEENETHVDTKGNTSNPERLKEDENETNCDRESIWNNILAKVQSKKKRLWDLLREGKLIDFTNQQIVLEFPSNLRFHKERIETPDEKKIIEEFAEAITGKRIKLKLTLSEKAKETTAPKETYVDKRIIDNKISNVGTNNRINSDSSIRNETIVNNDCVKKAIEIFEATNVEIRRVKK
ncbi:MAG: DNA polymerase III subunit gamma/tau [Candidatus Anammoxibacter sp.]